MLSQNSLDNLVQPIIERQEKINLYILNKLAERINKIGTLLPSDVQALTRLLNVGDDVRLINKELAKMTNLQESEIKKMIKQVAYLGYLDAKPFYDYRQQPFIPFDENLYLQFTVEAIAKQAAEEYVNLSKNLAFVRRDLRSGKLVPMTLHQIYTQVTDEAITAVQGGVVDYNTAMRKTLRELANYGTRVAYYPESGRIYTQRLDTAVRRNILDGVRAINQGVQDEVGKQFGADGVELSVHQYPAEDHAPIQGHQFYKEEYEKLNDGLPFKDVDGKSYSPIDRAIGTLNCRHFAYNIIVGESTQNYSNEQLQNILNRNDKGYTLPNGKHLTMYECTQYQRQLETKIRYAKDGQMLALTAGDRVLAEEYQAKINKYTQEYKAFSKACGLELMLKKASVSGYRQIKVH